MWKALFKKEFLGYFNNYSAYSIIAVYAALSILSAFYIGLYFVSDNPSMFSFFIFQPQIMALIIPAITMRTWAEERKTGSIELLFSYPLSTFYLVSAKIAAAYLVVIIIILFSVPLMLSTALLVSLHYATIASSYLALLLLSLMMVGLGSVVSAFCKQPIVAYLSSVFLGLMFISFDYAINIQSLPYYMSSSFSLMAQYVALLNGQLGLYPIFYFSLAFGGLFMINYIVIWQRNNSNINVILFAVFVLAIFILSSLLGNFFFGNRYLDLSESNKYTLSKVSAEISQNVSTPLELRFYISEDLSRLSLEDRAYATYVISTLAQYADKSGGKITLSVRKVSPFSQTQKTADNEGIVSKVIDGFPLYLGMNVLQNGKTIAKIPYFEPQRVSYLENDINRILFAVDKEKPTLAIVNPNLNMLDKNSKKQWSIVPLLQENYKLKDLDSYKSYVPFDVDVLVVVNPLKLPDMFIYALDQYLMRGGKLIVLLDPYSEALQELRGYPPQGKTNLTKLLANAGIVFDDAWVVGDENRAQYVAVGANREMKKYPLWFYGADNEKRRLAFRTAGYLNFKPEKAAAILETSANAGKMAAKDLRYLPKEKAFALYQPQNQAYAIVAQTTDDIYSIYRENPWEGAEYEDKIPPFLPISIEKPSLTVIADSDFVADDTWVLSYDEENPVYGTIPYTQNADFLMAIIDRAIKGREILATNTIKLALPKANIADKLYDEQYLPQAQKMSILEAEILKNSAKIEALQYNLRTIPYAEDLPVYQELALLEKKYGEKVKDLDEIKFLIGRNLDRKLNGFVAANIVIFPLLQLWGLFLLVVGYRRFGRRY